jgi:hypothetical protein
MRYHPPVRLQYLLQIVHPKKQLEVPHFLPARLRSPKETNPKLVVCLCIDVTNKLVFCQGVFSFRPIERWETWIGSNVVFF